MSIVLTIKLAIGGKLETAYPYSYSFALDQPAGSVDITAYNSGDDTCKIQWGDGEVSDVASGEEATHTYSAEYVGDVVVRSESPITVIEATDGNWTDAINMNLGRTPSFPVIRPEDATVTVKWRFKEGDQNILEGESVLLSVASGAISVPLYEYGEQLYDLTINGEAYDPKYPFEPVDSTLYTLVFKTDLAFTDSITGGGPFPTGGGIVSLEVEQDGGLTWTLPLNDGSGTTISNTDATTKYYRDITNLQLQSNNITAPTQSEEPTEPPANEDWPEVPGATGVVVFTADWESGSIQAATENPDGFAIQPSTAQDGLASDYKAKVLSAGNNWHGVSTPTPYAGSKCVGLYLDRDDWDGTNQPAPGVKPRSQLTKINTILPIQQNQEYWFGFAMWIPSTNFDLETFPDNELVLWQLHGSGDYSNISPCLALIVSDSGLQFKQITGDSTSPPLANTYMWTQSSIVTDEWQRFVVRLVPSPTSSGQLQIWRNNVKIVDRLNQANGYTMGNPSTSDSLYQCIDLYKAKLLTKSSSVDKATLFVDEYRCAAGTGSGSLVDPKYASVPN